MCSNTYLLVFILAWYGLAEMFYSISRLTDGIGTLEMPLSYRRFLRALFLAASGKN